MRKVIKKAGAAVLTMVMLLSMGAMTSVTVIAEKDVSQYTVYIKNVSEYNYRYGKIASLDTDGVTYTIESRWSNYFYVDSQNNITLKSDFSVNGKCKLSDFTSAEDVQELAKTLAAKGLAETQIRGSDTVSGLTPGYYIFSSPYGNAQPMLLEVKGDIDESEGLIAKANNVEIDKIISGITDNSTDENGLIFENSSLGLVSAGAKVEFTIFTNFPYYDPELLRRDNVDITDFVITDIPEDTLKYLTIKSVTIDGDLVQETEEYNVVDRFTNTIINATNNISNDKYFSDNTDDTAGQGLQIVFNDNVVLEHGGAEIVVVLEATVADFVDTCTCYNDEDGNWNYATVEYHNNYWTAGSKKNNDPEPPNDYDQNEVRVYATLVTVDKIDKDFQELEGAVFELRKGDKEDGPIVATIGEGKKLSTFEFKGLNVGTYTLVEKKTPSENYKRADSVTFTISYDYDDNSYLFSNTTNNNSITVINIYQQVLPGTGGFGTILFTFGGAATVLLAGVMFVLYMRKRKVRD